MKHYFYKVVVSLLALLMVMTSCANKGNDDRNDSTSNSDKESSTNVSSDYFYTNESGKIVRYDVVEKTAAIACPDPLCEHDSNDCPVSGVSSLVYFANDYLSYVKEEISNSYSEVYLYNVEAGTITTMLTIEANQIYYPWITNNREYVFFCASVLEWDEEKLESIGEIWSVYRYNIKTGELNQLKDNEGFGYRVLEDDGNRLLWDNWYLDTYFYTDYNFENIEEIEHDDYIGETVCDYYIYSDIGWTEYDDYYRTMYRQNIETGEVALIADYVSEMRYDDRFSPTGIAYTLFDYNEEYGYNAKSEIWWFDCESLETRLLIDVEDISDEFDIVRMPYSAGYNDYAGGYMMVSIGHTYTYINEYDEEEMSAHYTHNLFINPKTGDWFIMEPLY